MSKYFLCRKDDYNEELESFIISLIGLKKPTYYKDVVIYVFKDYDELMLEEAVKAYMFDLNNFFKCFISKEIDEKNIVSNYEMIYKYFLSAKKKEIYHEAELLDEWIYLNDNDLKKEILGPYYNDLEMQNIIIAFINNDLNILKTANDLYMHRNTLINKLDKFFKLTGYDLRKFKDSYLIYSLIKSE